MPATDALLASLLARPDTPFAFDPRLLERLVALVDRLAARPAERALLITTLHRRAAREGPTPVLLTALERLLASGPAEALAPFLIAYDERAEVPREGALFLRGILRLIDLDPGGLPAWLLLDRLFRRHGRPFDDLATVASCLATQYDAWRPGDAAARIVHLTAALRTAAIEPPAFLAALAALAAGGAFLPELLDRLAELFPPPGAPVDPAAGAVRRLGNGRVAARASDRLVALPLDLDEGLLPPGCLRWVGGDGTLLAAGYSLAVDALPPGTDRLRLEAENFEGEIGHREIALTVGDAPPPDPGFFTGSYRHPFTGKFDALRFITGFLAGFADVAPADAAPSPLSLRQAGRAYAASRRLSDFATLLSPAPSPARPCPIALFSTPVVIHG